MCNKYDFIKAKILKTPTSKCLMMYWGKTVQYTINVMPLIILLRLIIPTNSPEICHYHEIAQRMEVIKK